MITKPRLLIPLLTRIPVSLQAHLGGAVHSLIRGRAVGVVLLIGNQPADFVQLKTGRTEVITELIALYRRRCVDWIAVLDGLGLYQRDALLVIHDVQCLTF